MRLAGAAARMRVEVRELRGTAAPDRVLRLLAARARVLGLPPPAALTGDWFGSTAVIAPSVLVEPVAASDALTVPDHQPTITNSGAIGGGTAGSQAGGPTGGSAGAVVGGGWVGYLGFGLTDPLASRGRRLPVAAWGWADHVVRRGSDGRWWFEALVAEGGVFPHRLADELGAVVADAGADGLGRWHVDRLVAPDRERHERAIDECLEAIRAGEVYQANVCTRYELRLDGEPVDVFAAGVARYAPKHAAYLAGRWGALASLSPELFLARRGRHVRSSPIKGTAPRVGDEGPDAVNAALLAASAKDRAENVMIVDLVRNDFGRVCEPGTVTVPELLVVRPAPGVWHLVSTVDGRLLPQVSDAELLTATFPPGSVMGTPKLRALELLAGLESVPREAYCGAVGMASPVAGLQLNVAIRTLEFAPDGRAWIGVGGGITIDSEPAAEWAECLAKAAPLLDLLRTHDGVDTSAPGTRSDALPSTPAPVRP